VSHCSGTVLQGDGKHDIWMRLTRCELQLWIRTALDARRILTARTHVAVRRAPKRRQQRARSSCGSLVVLGRSLRCASGFRGLGGCRRSALHRLLDRLLRFSARLGCLLDRLRRCLRSSGGSASSIFSTFALIISASLTAMAALCSNEASFRSASSRSLVAFVSYCLASL
jgi:hypothetical protein